MEALSSFRREMITYLIAMSVFMITVQFIMNSQKGQIKGDLPQREELPKEKYDKIAFTDEIKEEMSIPETPVEKHERTSSLSLVGQISSALFDRSKLYDTDSEIEEDPKSTAIVRKPKKFEPIKM